MLRVDISRRTRGDHRDRAWVSGQDPLRSLLHLASPLLVSVGGVGKPLVDHVDAPPRALPPLAARQVPHTILDLSVEIWNAGLRRELHPALVFR
jgi:hypothetical protein